MSDDDIDYIIGEEDDFDETPELGIDYGLSDPYVQEHMGSGKAPQVRLNPGNKHKVIRKRIASISNDNGVLHVTFTDGCSLSIGE